MSNEKMAVVTELHKPARKNYPRRRVQMRGIEETWQADFGWNVTLGSWE